MTLDLGQMQRNPESILDSNMYLIGLTGGIASGKSTVSAVLQELGCSIIDADVVAREVVQPGKPSWKLIVKHFGCEVLLPDSQQLDRAKLGSIVFNDEQKRNLLNSCTHPYIRRAMLWKVVINFIRGESFVILVSPLLYETSGYAKKMNKIVVVSCTQEQQVERLMARDSLSEEDALRRLNAQMPLSEKVRKADIVLDNSLDKGLLRQQAYHLYTDLRKMTASQRWLRRLLVTIVVVTVVYSLISLLINLF